MGLLKSIDSVPGIQYYEYRDNTYYNHYEYRMRVNIPCVRYTWYCKQPEHLDVKLSGKFSGYGNVRKEDVQTVKDNISALKAIVQLQIDRKKTKTLGLRIESSTVAVFSNDLSELKALENKIGNQYDYDYTQVQTSEYAGIKHFVDEPKHKYRVYLKSKRVDDGFHIELKDMIKKMPTLYPSPALKRWLYTDRKSHGTWHFKWTSAAHFIDYDDESTLSYLALMHGEVLGKKYKLEKRPDTL